MTKTIKFVKKEIHSILVVKNEYEKMLNDERPENTKDYIKTLIKEYEEKLQALHQVKCELEAWEEIKKNFEIDVDEQLKVINIIGENYYGNKKFIGAYSKDGTLKVKKALEVKDEH